LDFKAITAEELLESVPDESTNWEFKSAALLGQKDELKKMLGKQVSGFANTGGGHIAIGVSDDRKLEPCAERIGNTRTKDALSSLVETSVEYSLQEFEIHRVGFKHEPENSIFVIKIADSATAPHQSKYDKTYYWRLEGKTDRAPHFHLDLLRNRFTKSVLKVVEVTHRIADQSYRSRNNRTMLKVFLNVRVKNTSMQSATAWGVHVKLSEEDRRWSVPINGFDRDASDGVCLHNSGGPLLPDEEGTIVVDLYARTFDMAGSIESRLRDMWANCRADIRAVSQNYISAVHPHGWTNSIEHRLWCDELNKSENRLRIENG